MLTIIIKEIRANVLSLQFTIMFSLLFLMTIGSAAILSATYLKQLKDYDLNRARELQAAANIESTHDLRFRGTTNYKPPNNLTLFATGLEKEMSRSIITSSTQGIEYGAKQYSNPVFSLFTAPDLAYIVNIVISLLALLFTFDAICGESESGTMKLALSNPVPRDRLLLGKCLGGYLSLAIPFVITVGLGLTVSQILYPMRWESQDFVRMVWLMGLSLLYIAVYFTMGLFISACNHRSSTALMICLFVWVITVLAIPNIVPIVARQVVKTPTAVQLAGERRAIDAETFAAVGQKMRDADEQTRRELWSEMREESEKRWRKIREDYLQRVEHQVQVSAMMSRASPSASFVFAASNLAESGVEDNARLREYAQKYKEGYDVVMRQIMDEERRRREQGLDQTQVAGAPAFDMKLFPEFNFEHLPPSRSLKSSFLDVGLLFTFTVIFFLGAFMKFMRYDLCK